MTPLLPIPVATPDTLSGDKRVRSGNRARSFARRWRRRPSPEEQLDRVAAEVERLSALVAAGAVPRAAWAYLARSSANAADRELAEAVADAAGRGAPLAGAFVGARAGQAADAWRRVGAAVALAAEIGAPQQLVLARSAVGLRGAAELHRTVRTAVSGPIASARLTLLLPPAAAVLGWAFGFDVPGVLLGSLAGAIVALVGALLLAAAAAWSRRLIAAASTVPWERGLGVELVALAVRAGLPADRARGVARTAAADVDLDVSADDAGVTAVVGFAAEAGIPVAALLDAEADRLRRTVLADAESRAATLAVRLLLPLGTLVLPAFLLLGAVPIGIAVLRSTSVPM